MLGKVSLVLVLIAAPLISQAQVTNLVTNPSFELAAQWSKLKTQQ